MLLMSSSMLTVLPTPAPPNRPTLPPLANGTRDRKSTRLNSSHIAISYAVFCLKKKIKYTTKCFISPNHVKNGDISRPISFPPCACRQSDRTPSPPIYVHRASPVALDPRLLTHR